MTDKIKNQILAVRATGAVNMFDLHRVSELCDVLGFDELQDYIIKNKTDYFNFILTGKVPAVII